MKTQCQLQFLLLVLLNLRILAAAQGTAFSYQGQMLENGVPAKGGHDFIFTLFNAAVAGDQIGPAVPRNNTPVSDGRFNLSLDFGANVFTGTQLWLEISVRPAGVGPFTKMDARVSLLPTPYAIFATSAASVDNGAVTANQLSTGGVPPARGQFLSYDGGNLVWSDPGAAGNVWSLNGTSTYYSAGNVGIGTANPTNGAQLEVNGTTRITPGGSGGFVSIGTPNGETGLGIIGANRADIRFDGSTLKLLAGLGATAPANGIAVNTLGSVGIGTFSPTPGVELEVNGTTRITPGGSGGFVSIGTPSGETGIGFVGNNRADLRFDGSTVKLVAGIGSGAPPSTEGIAVDTSGDVGIGTTTPAHRLSLIGGPLWTANLWTGALELGNASAIGWQANAGGQRFGIGQSTGGLYFFRTVGDPGTTGSPANYDVQITDDGTLQANGNATQAPNKGGFVKAMVYVNLGGIDHCYNGIRDLSSGDCGFVLTTTLGSSAGVYRINFGFPVSGRFVSITPQYVSGAYHNLGAKLPIL